MCLESVDAISVMRLENLESSVPLIGDGSENNRSWLMLLSFVSDVATHTVILEASTCTEIPCAYPARAKGDLMNTFFYSFTMGLPVWPSTLNSSDGLPLTISTSLLSDTNARHFPPVSQLMGLTIYINVLYSR